jgi:aminopeptidase-like protein
MKWRIIKKMFAKLTKLKKKINTDIKEIESLWDDNPYNDYYFAEIWGLKLALKRVSEVEAEEMLELDKWAEHEMKRRDAN